MQPVLFVCPDLVRVSLPPCFEEAMSYRFERGKLYRMPTHFGPSLGPRQGPDGRRFENKRSPRVTTVSVSFLTNEEQLVPLLPEGFDLVDEPMVTVFASYLEDIEWLAGRGYNVLGVTFPVVFHGEQDHVTGDFLSVLWENLADPIITGREDLGFSKLYCEIPEPVELEDQIHCTAGWLGFKFLDLQVRHLKQQTPEEITDFISEQTRDGLLHYKYMPRTGDWGEADAAYATLTPSSNPNQVIQDRWLGEGDLEFHQSRWEDLPTMYPIVNTFFELEVKAYGGASLTRTVGTKDLSDQRILR